MDERRLRLYRFLFAQGRMLIDDIPEPYKSVLQAENEGLGDG
jgi:hypothetical protein